MKQKPERPMTGAITSAAAVAFLAGSLLPGMEAKADGKSRAEFHDTGLVSTVRSETRQFRDVNEATALR